VGVDGPSHEFPHHTPHSSNNSTPPTPPPPPPQKNAQQKHAAERVRRRVELGQHAGDEVGVRAQRRFGAFEHREQLRQRVLCVGMWWQGPGCCCEATKRDGTNAASRQALRGAARAPLPPLKLSYCSSQCGAKVCFQLQLAIPNELSRSSCRICPHMGETRPSDHFFLFLSSLPPLPADIHNHTPVH
jgi:hypothetical protein